MCIRDRCCSPILNCLSKAVSAWPCSSAFPRPCWASVVSRVPPTMWKNKKGRLSEDPSQYVDRGKRVQPFDRLFGIGHYSHEFGSGQPRCPTFLFGGNLRGKLAFFFGERRCRPGLKRGRTYLFCWGRWVDGAYGAGPYFAQIPFEKEQE